MSPGDRGSEKHLRRQHGADLGEQHVARQGEQDVHSEGGEPHHPLEVGRILPVSGAGRK